MKYSTIFELLMVVVAQVEARTYDGRRSTVTARYDGFASLPKYHKRQPPPGVDHFQASAHVRRRDAGTDLQVILARTEREPPQDQGPSSSKKEATFKIGQSQGKASRSPVRGEVSSLASPLYRGRRNTVRKAQDPTSLFGGASRSPLPRKSIQKPPRAPRPSSRLNKKPSPNQISRAIDIPQAQGPDAKDKLDDDSLSSSRGPFKLDSPERNSLRPASPSKVPYKPPQVTQRKSLLTSQLAKLKTSENLSNSGGHATVGSDMSEKLKQKHLFSTQEFTLPNSPERKLKSSPDSDEFEKMSYLSPQRMPLSEKFKGTSIRPDLADMLKQTSLSPSQGMPLIHSQKRTSKPGSESDKRASLDSYGDTPPKDYSPWSSP